MTMKEIASLASGSRQTLQKRLNNLKIACMKRQERILQVMSCNRYSVYMLGELIMLENSLVLYKSSIDLFFYLVAASADENEIMLSAILNSFYDAMTMVLRYSSL